MGKFSRPIAAVAALAGWAGLVLQLVLIVRNLGVLIGLWRFIGFFTILTNIGAAMVATAVALSSRGAFAGGRARLMAATSILMVGIVYSLALRALWNPAGAQKVADVLLHDAAPLAWLALWLAAPPGRLRWSDAAWALVPPALYFVYALARGAHDGWYAYWFLNPAQQSAGELLLSIVAILCGFAVVAAALVGISRWLGDRRADGLDIVDEASRESFPASDPPSWTTGRGP